MERPQRAGFGQMQSGCPTSCIRKDHDTVAVQAAGEV